MESNDNYSCSTCNKQFNNMLLFNKHTQECNEHELSSNGSESENENENETETENKDKTYDINMRFTEDKQVQIQVENKDLLNDNVVDDILNPKISSSYREEIDKLNDLLNYVKNIPIPNNDEDKDITIKSLKDTITALMEQSKCLIEEMEKMCQKNSYLKNNVMLAAFVLDKCRKEIPEYDDFKKVMPNF